MSDGVLTISDADEPYVIASVRLNNDDFFRRARGIVVNVKLLRFLAWGGLCLVAIVSLAPIGLRPESGFSVSIERFSTFAAIGLAFTLAYPRHAWLALFIAAGSALLLEVLQMLAPSRHAHLFDALVKVAGGAAGVVLGQFLRRFWVG